jgi:hypothetical protein
MPTLRGVGRVGIFFFTPNPLRLGECALSETPSTREEESNGDLPSIEPLSFEKRVFCASVLLINILLRLELFHIPLQSRLIRIRRTRQ